MTSQASPARTVPRLLFRTGDLIRDFEIRGPRLSAAANTLTVLNASPFKHPSPLENAMLALFPPAPYCRDVSGDVDANGKPITSPEFAIDPFVAPAWQAPQEWIHPILLGPYQGVHISTIFCN